MRKVSRAKNANLIVSGGLILVGIFLLVWPGTSVEFVCRILGIAVAIIGLAKILGYFSNDLYRLAFQFDLALGIFSIIIGMILILRPERIISIAHIIIGVYILIESVFKVQTAVDAAKFGIGKWWFLMTGAVISVLLGLFLIFCPFKAAKAIVRIIGIALIFEGVESFFTTVYTVSSDRKKEDISAEYKELH